MGVVEHQLGGVLDGEDPFRAGDVLADQVQHGGLTGAGAAADNDIAARFHRADQHVQTGVGHRAVFDQLLGGQVVTGELTDTDGGSVQSQRRDDRVDPRAIRQPGVHHRAGFVQAPAQRRQHAANYPGDVVIVDEPGIGSLQDTGYFHENVLRAVHQNVVDAGVRQQRLQRTEAGDFIKDIADQLIQILGG